MIKGILSISVILLCAVEVLAQKPQKIWFKYDNRFIQNFEYNVHGADSILFGNYMTAFADGKTYLGLYKSGGAYYFSDPGRILVLPSTYSSNDYTKETSTYCFQRSQESEHFVVFWAKGLTLQSNGNLTGGASTSVCNVNTLLANAEKIWNVYVDSLQFLEPGNSKTTDKVKIQMYVVNQSDWRADGSGVDGVYYVNNTSTSVAFQTGIFHCNPWAASSDVTVAHEIGHTFQYLVSADLGQTHGLNYTLGTNSSGNEWWEDCANWQAHKVYPAQQFSENWGNNQSMHHMNILSEDARYNNCYYQDWWCQKHGLNTIGRVWRESVKPEDPVQAYMRIFDLDEQSFADEQYDGYAHIASMDIDRWQKYGQGLIGSEQQRLKEIPDTLLGQYADIDKTWWVVDSAYCPQNYGYNANPLKVPSAGTKVTAHFKGIAGATGYRRINKAYAGWRYGLVAYSSDGKRTYGDMGKDADGEVSITVPDNCQNIWFVVMGAPTKYWTHSWNGDVSDDEQWPYAVKFDGTDPYGASRTYGEYADDYARHDTTVVINATLAYNATSYTSTRVQYDMDAISQALGVSTKQMQALKRNTSPSKGSLVFAGVNANGTTMTYNTTTSTSSATCYGHWFTTAGNVCSYTTSAGIFAELYPDKYGCYVGQYPGHLVKGKTYVIRQAVIYTHTDGKKYTAIMEVHLCVK